MIEHNTLQRLQSWYMAMVNGDWEHTYGITIENIDNPGWSFRVEVIDTPLYQIDFDAVVLQRKSDDDWIHCKVQDGVFRGACGPTNLQELITIFLDWADANQ